MDDTSASDHTPRSPSKPPDEFNPFPFGAPNADSPVAAAFPEIFPAPAPVPNPYAPPAASPYPQPAPTPWGPPPSGASPSAAPPSGAPPWGTSPTTPLTPNEPPTFHGYYPGQAPPGSAPGYPSGYPSGYGQQQPPPGYSPGYPSSYPPAYPGPGTAGNGKAVAGLVLGILSLGLFFLTVLDVPLIVLGIVFSALGLRAAKRGEGRRTMALAGLICSLVAVVVVTVALTYIVARGHTCEQRFDRGSSEYNNCLLHLN